MGHCICIVYSAECMIEYALFNISNTDFGDVSVCGARAIEY